MGEWVSLWYLKLAGESAEYLSYPNGGERELGYLGTRSCPSWLRAAPGSTKVKCSQPARSGV